MTERSEQDRPRSDKPRSDKPRSDRPSSDRSGGGRPASDRPRSDKPRSDKPRSDRPSSDRSGGGRPTGDRPRSDRPRSDRPSSDRSGGAPRRDDRAGGGRPTGDRPRSDRPRSDRPSSDRSGGGRPASDRPRSDRPSSDRARSDRSPRRDDDESRESRGPWIPEEIQFEDLDKSVRFELQTLPETLQERVGRHLLAAEVALSEDDMKTALEHSRQAKKLAGRVAVVREANGTMEYLAGEYAAALNELRAVRRMTGSNDFVAMMADCERGLGRPEKAIEFLKSIPVKDLAPETRIEALMVSAGARADLGQVDAAILMMNVGALTSLPAGDLRARLQEAYSDLLGQAGRKDESLEWRKKALKSDINGVTAFSASDESEISAHLIEELD